MQKAAIYARYSTDEQKATSIEDQVRRAREKAKALGYEVPDELVFSDELISGTAKGLKKRKGYEALMRAWDRGGFDALFVDEVSRLAREPVSLAALQVRIEKGSVRFVSTDGLDSAVNGWQLQFGFCAVIAAHFVRETGHRVVRGMVGQLERGFMVAKAPFGYEAHRPTEAGTTWTIDEEKAKHVREIFRLRRRGASFVAIARTLNDLGIPTPRKSTNGTVRYWRPATVRQLLRNTIYRGLFIWNGSPFSKAKEKRGETTLSPQDYLRPDLRIVDDDTWFFCNQTGKGCIVRGGDKHAFAGLVSCGTCDATLTVATGGSAPSLYCAQCAQARALGVAGRDGNYVSSNALQAVLIDVVERLFSGEAAQLFRERLRARLEGGCEARIAEVRQLLGRKEAKVLVLVRLMSSQETDDPAVDQEYRLALAEKRRLVAELNGLETTLSKRDSAAIERQLEVDPRQLLPRLFSGEVPAEQLRAALRRLFPKIVRLGKPHKYCTEFSIEFAPGATVAEVSGTTVMESTVVTIRIRVTGGALRPSKWLVEEIK
jgi:DNA invertase Pin-like site-specific DNA recombinase